MRLPFWLTLVTLSACSPPSIRTEDFRTECAVDSDCMLIEVGNRCDCSCERLAAISVKDRERYEELHARAFSPEQRCGKDCGPCQAMEAVAFCEGKRCAHRAPEAATPVEPPPQAAPEAAPPPAVVLSRSMTPLQVADTLHAGIGKPFARLRHNRTTGEARAVGPDAAEPTDVSVTDLHLLAGTVRRWSDQGTAALLVWGSPSRSARYFELVLQPAAGAPLRTGALLDAPDCGAEPIATLEPELEGLAVDGGPVIAVRFGCQSQSKMDCSIRETLSLLVPEAGLLRPAAQVRVSDCNLARDPEDAYPECLEACPPGRVDHALLEVLPGPPPRLKKTSTRSGTAATYSWSGGQLRTEDPEPIRSGP